MGQLQEPDFPSSFPFVAPATQASENSVMLQWGYTKWSYTKKFTSCIRYTSMGKKRLLICALGFIVTVVLYFMMLSRHESHATDFAVAAKEDGLDVEQPLWAVDIGSNRGRVFVCIFTGRWQYLRILLPYLYRELRQNGGVVDKVLFVMLRYTKETQVKLKNFSETANDILNDEVFRLVYFKNDPITEKDKEDRKETVNFGKHYEDFHYHVFQRLKENPLDVYFKMDDDIVFLQPNVFGIMLMKNNSSDCFIHFANIVSNWRCNWLHQKIGVFDKEVNPKGLNIEYGPFAGCGWERADCAEMILHAFVHHYRKNQTSRYLFPEREHTTDRLRFSINFFLFDTNLVNVKRLMEAGPINQDDERWWTETYSATAPHPNCIVGEALVVHFSYFTTEKKMLDLGLLKEFEQIVRIELRQTLPQLLWNAVEFL